jgi:hypothetical protein
MGTVLSGGPPGPTGAEGPAGPAGEDTGSIFATPSSPHADDEEFDGDLSAWSFTGTLNGTPDPYSSPGAGETRSNVNVRPSWAWFQPQASGTSYYLFKSLAAVGSNMFLWTRGAFSHRYSASGVSELNNDNSFGLVLCVAGAPNPSISTNSVAILINETDAGSFGVQFHKIDATVTTVVTTTSSPLAGQVIEAVGLQKINTNYIAWAFTGGGNALYLGTLVHATTFDTVALQVQNNSAAGPAESCMGFDFVRRKDSALFLPSFSAP